MAYTNKYYLEKNTAKYVNSKKYISMKQNILILKKTCCIDYFI